jgi:hypothetical protein
MEAVPFLPAFGQVHVAFGINGAGGILGHDEEIYRPSYHPISVDSPARRGGAVKELVTVPHRSLVSDSLSARWR